LRLLPELRLWNKEKIMRAETNARRTVRQPTWQRVILLGVLGYEGIGALIGGTLLVAAPDGRFMDMPVDLMHGVFPDFLVPGLILFGLGILNTAAFVAVWRRTRTDWLLAGLALGGLAVWFIVEIAILRELHWLHAMWGLPVLIGGLMVVPLLPSRTEMRDFVKRHAVPTYYAVAFAISWGVLVLIISGQGGVPRTPDAFARQVSFAIPAMLGGPAIAGILMTALVSGKAGFGELFSRLHRWRVGARWYAVALLTAPLVFAVVHTVLSLVSPTFLPGFLITSDKAPFLMMGVAAALMVGFFEELGWTGFAIPQLRLRYGVLATGLIAGVLWAVWHLPFIRVWPVVALTEGLPLGAFLAATSFVVLVGQLPAYRVLMVWVYEHTESLLVAVLMHMSLTASTFILGPAWVSGAALLVYDLALAAAWWLVVAAVALVNRGHLTRQPVGVRVAPDQPARVAA
jgi:membrane protease YdiL (CAAX protease family)